MTKTNVLVTTKPGPGEQFLVEKAVPLPAEILATVADCARGSYQTNLLCRLENWSGSSLRGKASDYGARYAASRANLLARINAALPEGWDAETRLVLDPSAHRWKRELVLCNPDGYICVW